MCSGFLVLNASFLLILQTARIISVIKGLFHLLLSPEMHKRSSLTTISSILLKALFPPVPMK